MHAFDCFLEQLARRARDRRGGEKGTFAKAPVVVERVRVKESNPPFVVTTFRGKRTDTRTNTIRESFAHAYIYIYELWHRDEDGNAYTPGGGVPFLFAASLEKETKRERERERERVFRWRQRRRRRRRPTTT